MPRGRIMETGMAEPPTPDRGEGVAADRKTITVSRLRRPRGFKHGAVLAMDGTGDETLNAQLFGPTLRHERIAIERDASTTGTIGKKYSRQSMTGIDAKG